MAEQDNLIAVRPSYVYIEKGSAGRDKWGEYRLSAMEDRRAALKWAAERLRKRSVPISLEQSRLARRWVHAVTLLSQSVEINPRKRHGAPVLRGTRFKVAQVLAQFAAGDSLDYL